MPTLTIEYATDDERIELERFIAYVQEMRAVGLTAAHGTVMDICETFALGQGRQLISGNLQAVIQARADAEKKSLEPSSKDANRGG